MNARKLCKNTGPHPIHINEDLTRQRLKLAYNARVAKRSKIIDNTWTYYGKIFVKLLSNEVKVVTTQEKLDHLLANL